MRNIDSLPASYGELKSTGIITDIQDAQLDIVGLSKMNLAWQNIQGDNSLHLRFRKNFEACKFVSSNNRTDSPVGTTTQFGGTLTGTTGRITYRVHSCGYDTTKLGQWSWIAIRGANNSITRVVTCYRPCRNSGETTTYQQQLAGLRDVQRRCENS